MPIVTEQLLRLATISTFEDLTFLVPDADCSLEQSEDPFSGFVTVAFHGPFNGCLVIRASESVLPAIAGNMLGEDESKERRLQRDACGEVANVVCGNLLPLLAGKDAQFRLDAPQWESMPFSEVDVPMASAAMGIDDGRIEVRLYVGNIAVQSVA